MSLHHDFLMTRAREARAEAEAATLDNVRDRCLRAAAAWDAMAVRLLKTETYRAKQAAEKALIPSAQAQVSAQSVPREDGN